MLWLKENLGTLIIGLVLLGIVTAIIVRLVLRKKSGKCIACDCCNKCKVSDCAAKAGKKDGVDDRD